MLADKAAGLILEDLAGEIAAAELHRSMEQNGFAVPLRGRVDSPVTWSESDSPESSPSPPPAGRLQRPAAENSKNANQQILEYSVEVLCI